MEGECSQRIDFFILWEDGMYMCCPKVCYTCRGPDTDAECNGGTNTLMIQINRHLCFDL